MTTTPTRFSPISSLSPRKISSLSPRRLNRKRFSGFGELPAIQLTTRRMSCRNTAQFLDIERRREQAVKNDLEQNREERYFNQPKLLEIDLNIDHNQVQQIFTYDCSNWFTIMLSVYGRTNPWRPWAVVMAITLLYVLTDSKYEIRILGEGFLDINFNPTVHGTIGIVLGFLIVYQGRESSQRWWEGRQAWERIVVDSREAMRLLCCHCNGKELIQLFGRYLIALSICTKHYLTKEKFTKENPCPELKRVFKSKDTDLLYKLSTRSRPLACLFALQRIVELAIKKKLIVRPVGRDINPRLVNLSNDLGTCEQILYTPMPWFYTLHLRTVLLGYCCTLPMAFSFSEPVPGWLTVTIYVLLLSYAFLGLEDMAKQIQNPFGTSLSDIPLTIFVQIVQNDIEEIVRLKYIHYNNTFSEKLEAAVCDCNIRVELGLPGGRIYPNSLKVE